MQTRQIIGITGSANERREKIRYHQRLAEVRPEADGTAAKPQPENRARKVSNVRYASHKEPCQPSTKKYEPDM